MKTIAVTDARAKRGRRIQKPSQSRTLIHWWSEFRAQREIESRLRNI